MIGSQQLVEGMEVRDTHGHCVGQVREIRGATLVVRLQEDVAVPSASIDVTDDAVVVLREHPAEISELAVTTGAVLSTSPTHSDAACVCHACGTNVQTEHAVRYDDAWFCATCWRMLPSDRIARVVREVALSGVPWS